MDSQPPELFKNDYQVCLGFGANYYKISASPSSLSVQTLKGRENIPNLCHRMLQHCVCNASSSRCCQWVPTQTKTSEHGADRGKWASPHALMETERRVAAARQPLLAREAPSWGSRTLQVQKTHGARVSLQISYVPSKVTVF